MTAVQRLIQEQFAYFSPKLDEPLAPLTYFKIGGPAEVLLDLVTRDQIVEVGQFCHHNQIKLTILGGASNVIVSSQGISGVVIRTLNEEYQVLPEKAEQKQLIRVGVGYKTGLFVRKTIDDGFAGLEYFLGVPGRIGGAIYNNAHYLSDLIGTHIHRVEVLRPDGKTAWLDQAECQFSYDHSIFQTSRDILLQVDFSLAGGNKEHSMELVKEATMYRAETQPLGEPSSGCYFRNVANTELLKTNFPQYAKERECPSAFLIDQAGLKGTRVGDVEVSSKHAAFFINVGQGTSDQVRELAALVKKKVQQQFGVELREEVFFLE